MISHLGLATHCGSDKRRGGPCQLTHIICRGKVIVVDGMRCAVVEVIINGDRVNG